MASSSSSSYSMALASKPSSSQNNGNPVQPAEVVLNAFGRPVDNLDLDSDSDTDSESEDDMPRYVPVPERDQVLEYVNEIITGIRRLTPAMREMAKSQIRLILQRYLRPDWENNPPQRIPPSVPRVPHRHG